MLPIAASKLLVLPVVLVGQRAEEQAGISSKNNTVFCFAKERSQPKALVSGELGTERLRPEASADG